MYRGCMRFSNFMPGGMLIMLIALIAIGFGIYWIYTNNKPKSNVSTDAIKILEERFSKGEIDEDEFESKRKVLERNK